MLPVNMRRIWSQILDHTKSVYSWSNGKISTTLDRGENRFLLYRREFGFKLHVCTHRKMNRWLHDIPRFECLILGQTETLALVSAQFSSLYQNWISPQQFSFHNTYFVCEDKQPWLSMYFKLDSLYLSGSLFNMEKKITWCIDVRFSFRKVISSCYT